jgi:hypothetical protein
MWPSPTAGLQHASTAPKECNYRIRHTNQWCVKNYENALENIRLAFSPWIVRRPVSRVRENSDSERYSASVREMVMLFSQPYSASRSHLIWSDWTVSRIVFFVGQNLNSRLAILCGTTHFNCSSAVQKKSQNEGFLAIWSRTSSCKYRRGNKKNCQSALIHTFELTRSGEKKSPPSTFTPARESQKLLIYSFTDPLFALSHGVVCSPSHTRLTTWNCFFFVFSPSEIVFIFSPLKLGQKMHPL